MNFLDVFVLITLGLTVFFGLWKGLVRQVLSLIGLIAGFFLAISFYKLSASFLPFSDGIAEIVGFLLIFFGVMLSAMLLALLLDKIIHAVELSWLNRLGGGVIGFLKGGVIVAVVTLLLVAFLPVGNTMLRSSINLSVILSAVDWVRVAVPDDLETRYELKLQALNTLRWTEGSLEMGKDAILNVLETPIK